MQKSRRQIKYNQTRHPKDALYSQYALNVFLNKFTKSGKSATSLRYYMRAFGACKFEMAASPFWLVNKALKQLHLPLFAARTRKGKEIKIIPAPLKRYKKIRIARQLLTKTIQLTYERNIVDTLRREIVDTYRASVSAVSLRKRSDLRLLLCKHRTNIDFLWQQ